MQKAVVVFLLAVIAALSSAAYGQVPEARFSDRAFVTAIDVVVEVRDARGQTPADLTPSDFELRENGVKRTIIALDYLDSPASTASTSTPATPAAPRATPQPDWQVVVWFDAMTMSRGTLATNGRELARRAADLLELGPVTVVYSDLKPDVVVDSMRDPRKLAQAIDSLLKRPPGDRIARIRREFLVGLEDRAKTSAGSDWLPGYIAEEERLLQVGRTNMTRWLARTPRRVPRALVYVGDGFDLDPAEFYAQALAGAGTASADLQKIRSDSEMSARLASSELAKRLAVEGWTVLAIGGASASGHFSDDVTRSGAGRVTAFESRAASARIFRRPAEPLAQLAGETGGERIASASALPKALAALEGRIRITYQVDREPDPVPRRVEILPVRAGLTVRASRWASSTTTESVAEARAIDLLGGQGSGGDLDVVASLLPAATASDLPRIEGRIDFAPLSAAAPQIGATKLRLTLAIEIPGSPPVVIHQLADVENLGSIAAYVWRAPIKLPESVGAIAVVAEELTTGAWGSARIEPAGAAVAHGAAPASAQAHMEVPAVGRADAFARAAAERKPLIALEWGDDCAACVQIEKNVRSDSEIARLLQPFVVVVAPPPDEDTQPRIALYDASQRLFLSWPVIQPGRKDGLSISEIRVIVQRAAAAAPDLRRASDRFASGKTVEARLALGQGYRRAGDEARGEMAFREAAEDAAEAGDVATAQTAGVFAALAASNQGRAEAALGELRTIAASPATPFNEAEAQLVIALIERARGRRPEAAAALDRALELAPPETDVYQTALSLSEQDPSARLTGAGAEASRPLRLVVAGSPPFSGRIRLQVIVRDPTTSSVTFRVDDAPEMTDADPPFEVTVDVGSVPRRHEIRAVARDVGGTVAGEDAVIINERHDEFWVRLRATEGSPIVRAETNVPAGARLARLEFFVDGRPVSALETDPAAIKLPPTEEGVVVRALATLADGKAAEDARLIGAGGYSETIEARDVEIYAGVFDSSGAPVSNLDRSQFQLAEDGRSQRIRGFEFLGRVPFSAGIAIDSSGSMNKTMPDVHRAARAFLERVLADGSSAFIVDFDTSPRLAAPRTTRLPELQQAVSRIRADGSTALYDAIIFGLLQLQGIPGKRALIVLTDGRDQTSRYGSRDAMRVARESGVAIYAIILPSASVSPPPRTGPPQSVSGSRRGSLTPSAGSPGVPSAGLRGPDPQLDRIAAQSGGRAWHVRDSADIEAIYRAIDLELRNQYRLTYRTAPGRGASDWRDVKVTVDVPEATVRTAAGFIAR